ncbi:MAG: hypothetical protein QNL87_00430 [Gammaproteobacteria bacterium]|nr:hypothetical protein [Gammaproteobacteria bacterium]
MCTCRYKGLKDQRSRHQRNSGVRRVEVRFDNINTRLPDTQGPTPG